jgi:ribosomal subunit interface protein
MYMADAQESQEFTELPIEFYNETDELDEQLQEEAESRIHKLAQGHQDIVGASVKITQPAQGRDNSYQVNVTLFMRPEYISATQEGEVLFGTLKQALDRVERQAREQRSRLRGH